MRLSGVRRPWSWDDVFARRLQPSRVNPPEEVWRLYRREVVTPPLTRERRHTLRRAF